MKTFCTSTHRQLINIVKTSGHRLIVITIVKTFHKLTHHHYCEDILCIDTSSASWRHSVQVIIVKTFCIEDVSCHIPIQRSSPPAPGLIHVHAQCIFIVLYPQFYWSACLCLDSQKQCLPLLFSLYQCDVICNQLFLFVRHSTVSFLQHPDFVKCQKESPPPL